MDRVQSHQSLEKPSLQADDIEEFTVNPRIIAMANMLNNWYIAAGIPLLTYN